eukprot:TRINITY_DN1880_c0_g2_i1.p2 TRINITY_DN1880_c0_g2~~TRINITY_DN1880_c0_g2_i1.p2  ORF type:complete len:109 (-),score=12.03 TRINITY_DN1880_c0_g2_i1:79-405(-)
MDSVKDDGTLLPPGFPIRTSPDQNSCAVPRSFSQLTTSFIACQCQGILHVPLVAQPPHVLCVDTCLLYTSDAADDMQCVDLGGRRIIKKKKKYNKQQKSPPKNKRSPK